MTLRRHIAHFKVFDNALPRLRLVANVFGRGKALQVQVAPLRLRGVAVKAILLDQRQNSRSVTARRRIFALRRMASRLRVRGLLPGAHQHERGKGRHPTTAGKRGAGPPLDLVLFPVVQHPLLR